MATPRWDPIRKRWQMNVQVNGHRRPFYSSNPSDRSGPAECKRKAALWKSDELTDKSNWRLERAWEAYIESMSDMVGDATILQRKQYGKLYILPRLKLKKMSAISDQDWQDTLTKAGRMVSARTKRKLSLKTLKNIRSLMMNFCLYAKRSRMIETIPTALILPKSAVCLSQSIMQPIDIVSLFAPSDEWYINLWRLRAIIGLRPGEGIGLQVFDVNDGYLTVRRSVTTMDAESKGKTKKALRKIKLPIYAQYILDDQKKMLASKGIKSEWLFPNKWGERAKASGISSAWDRFRAANNITCTMYGIRHSQVSLTKNDLPLALMKLVVGHEESMDTLGVYGHEVDGELEQAAGIIDTVFDRILGTRFKNTHEVN